MTYPARHLSIAIDCPPDQAYDFIANPRNLPAWAAGLSGAIREVEGDWIADSPMGAVKVSFAPRNSFGVVDHVVTLPSGMRVLNPMRVLPNHEGCEVVFTLYWLPGISDEDYREDVQAIERDLQVLKRILEQ